MVIIAIVTPRRVANSTIDDVDTLVEGMPDAGASDEGRLEEDVTSIPY
jgi:hypothetical protein